MVKPFSLQSVLDLMQTRTDDAARELGRRIGQERDAREQLRLLEEYRREYVERFQAAALSGMGPGQWQNYQAFIGRLDEAIGQQKQILSRSENQTAAGQQQWLEQKNRLRAFDTLAVRHFDRERTRDGRQEQKSADEFTARRHSGTSARD